MTTSATSILWIDSFCNCKGCIDKVKKALGKLEDVYLLEMDPEIGKFTISTSEHPQVIKFAIKDTFPRKKVTLSPEIDFNPKNQPNPYILPPTIHNRQGCNDVYLENFPPPPPPPPAYSKPSAPPIPTTEYQLYGYPPHFYGF